MNYSNFTRADLSQADFSDAFLMYANFTGSCLFETDFRGAKLLRNDFSNAEMHQTNLQAVGLTKVNFMGANINKANLNGINTCQALNIASFQAGKRNRVCYAVKHEHTVMFKIGCFWGNTKQAIEKIRQDYGMNSTYEECIILYTKIMKEMK